MIGTHRGNHSGNLTSISPGLVEIGTLGCAAVDPALLPRPNGRPRRRSLPPNHGRLLLITAKMMSHMASVWHGLHPWTNLFRSPGKGNRNQLFGAFKQDSPARAEYGAAQRAGPERWRGFRLTGPL